MIVLILLGIGVLIGVALIISCFFETETVACYDPKSTITRDFRDVEFKNPAEKARVRDEIEAEYRSKHKLKPEDPVDEYYIRYYDTPVKLKTRLAANGVDFDTIRGYAGWITGVVMLIAFAATGITCIAHHGPLHQEEYATKLTVELDDLHDRQETIYLTLAGDLNFKVNDSGTYYHVIVDKPLDMAQTINEYNTDVKAFKQHMYLEKIRSTNPWTNTFINPGFKKVEGYNGSAKSYKDILGDTLKTFELKSNGGD